MGPLMAAGLNISQDIKDEYIFARDNDWLK